MKMKIHKPFFVFFVLCSTLVLRSAAIPSNYLLGVAPEEEKYYRGLWSSGTTKCKDGSKSFTKSQLNDDFCDCSDGTDEPGTSACPTGKFYCQNAGHIPRFIFSSRINDGICDCCDGSDEYDSKIKCKNTCWEAGKVARDRLMKNIAIYEEGVNIRRHDVEQSKISKAKEEAELSSLMNEENILKGIVEQLKERKEQIEKAIEKERIQKEKEEKQKKEAEESESKEHKGEDKVDVAEEQEPAKSDDNDKVGILDNSPSSQNLKDSAAPAVEVAHNDHASFDNGEEKEEEFEVAHGSDPNAEPGSKGEDATKDTSSLSREELGREIGSRWTGKKTEQQNNDIDNAKKNDETSVNVHDEENNGYDTETDEDYTRYEDDDTKDHIDDVEDESNDDSSSSYKSELDDEVDISDIESTSSHSWFEKIQRTVRNFLQSVNPFQTPVDTSEAESVRKEYDEASAKLSKIKSRVSRLKRKLANDFGPEKEFYSLYGQCFETKQNKYVYKVCPFQDALQVEGYSTTSLGQWAKFEDSYRVMLFSKGDKCWNGPDRSLKVRLRCGLKIEVADVGEPSRCEYAAVLTTPAVCLETKLKELQDELKDHYKEESQPHDEL